MLSFIYDLSGTKAEGDNFYNAVFNRFQTFNLSGLSEHPNTKSLMDWVRGKITEADQWANKLANGALTEDQYYQNMKAFAGGVSPILDQIQQISLLPYPSGGGSTGGGSSGGTNQGPSQGGSGTSQGDGGFSWQRPLGPSTNISPAIQWGILGGGALLVFLTLSAVTRRG